MSSARRNDGIRQAVAARERGRAKVRSTTTTVTVASVVTAGALALALPGSSEQDQHVQRIHLDRHVELLGQLGLQLHRLGSSSTGSGSSSASSGSSSTGSGSRLRELRIQLYELRLELRRLQLRLVTQLQLRRQPGHLGRLLMPATATDAEASASWRALGTLVQLRGHRPGRPARGPPPARRRPRRGGRGLQPVPGRLRDPLAAQAAGSSVSPLLAEAIGVALRAARLTDGDVDPTVGAAMSAAGYDRDFHQIEPNGPPLRLTVRQVPGWREVRLDGRSLTLPAGVRLDLGATAKAWAADRSAARIAAQPAAACWSAWAATSRSPARRPPTAGASGCRT